MKRRDQTAVPPGMRQSDRPIASVTRTLQTTYVLNRSPNNVPAKHFVIQTSNLCTKSEFYWTHANTDRTDYYLFMRSSFIKLKKTYFFMRLYLLILISGTSCRWLTYISLLAVPYFGTFRVTICDHQTY